MQSRTYFLHEQTDVNDINQRRQMNKNCVIHRDSDYEDIFQ